MKRCFLVVGLLVFLCLQPGLEARPKNSATKETPIDLSAKKNIFLGWVNLSPDQWSLWGYASKEEWSDVIKEPNLDFQSSCQGQYLAGRKVSGAKDSSDENASGSDLYIKFSDVSIDHAYYGIRLSIHFIDPQTNTEIASVPSRLYYEKRWFKFQLYMRGALDEVSKKLEAEVTGSAPRK
jgi:hypothetical protein